MVRKMKGYVVCVYKSIHNENALKEYATKARIAVEKYKGKFLIRGGKKITTEGEESPRTVVIEFPSFAEAENFLRTVIWEFPSYDVAIECHESKEYQEGWSLAKDTTERNLQITQGFNIE